MTMKRAFIIFSLFFSLILGCSSKQPASDDQAAMGDSSLVPNSELSDAQIFLYDKGEVTTEIKAKRIIRFEKIDSTMAYSLDVSIYDSTGEVTTTVVGDSGIIRENTGNMYIYGNVVVVTEDNFTLETDYLFWDEEKDKIKTDAFVRITQNDDVVTGWGLIADQQLKSYKILKRVSGTIKDPKKLEEP